MGLMYVRESDLLNAGLEARESALTSTIFTGGQPLSEADYLALGETPERIELFDGCLHVSPAGIPWHQYLSAKLTGPLMPACDAAGLVLLGPVNLRLRPGRIVNPDLVVITPTDLDNLVVDVATVRLVCEITSPAGAVTDRVLKRHYYAAAGIPWFLLVEGETAALHLFRLDGEAYREQAVAVPGEILHLDDPVEARIDPAELLAPS